MNANILKWLKTLKTTIHITKLDLGTRFENKHGGAAGLD
jgi:hypothetical protein